MHDFLSTILPDKGTLYKVYRVWALGRGHQPLAQPRLTRKLSERGHRLDSGRRNVTGLELNADGMRAMGMDL